jgi:hypothetical protein
MKLRAPWLLGMSVVFGIVAVLLWVSWPGRPHPNVAATAPVRQLRKTVEAADEPFAPLFSKTAVPSTPRTTLRQRFREANDYSQLVKDVEAQAVAGDPEAQYVTAEALRWCSQTLKLYFIRPNGH